MTDNDGRTPLHSCLESDKHELLQFLIDIGSNMYLNIKEGRSCLHIAAEKGDLILYKTLTED